MLLNMEQQQFMEELYQNHRGIMVVTAKRTLEKWDGVDASQYIEEAVQDGVMRLIQQVNKLQQLETKSLLSYIVKTIQSATIEICHNIKNKEMNEQSFEEGSEVARQEAYGNLDEIEAKRELCQTIHQLSDSYRQVIEGVFLENKDYHQVGKELNISQSTVRKRVERGKQKLQELLEKGGDNDQDYKGCCARISG